MGQQQNGPTCLTRLGEDWIDAGTSCLARSYPPGSVKDAAASVSAHNACQKEMQKNVPEAHQRALQKLAYTLKYFTDIREVIAKARTLQEVVSGLGQRKVTFLVVYWNIPVDPGWREMKRLVPSPPQQEMAEELLEPIDSILSVYQKTNDGLKGGDFEYQCEYRSDWLYAFSACDRSGDVEGYVRTVVGKPFGGIHICVDALHDVGDLDKLASLIVHEASHKFAGTDDTSAIPWQNAHRVQQGMPEE